MDTLRTKKYSELHILIVETVNKHETAIPKHINIILNASYTIQSEYLKKNVF